MAWLILLLAGITEIAWAVGLKFANGFTKFWPSALVLGISAISLWLLSVAVKTIPLGTAYAVWTGIGILGTVTFGILYFHEPVTLIRVVFIACILIGIVGLHTFS